jgi:hypothetical protein
MMCNKKDYFHKLSKINHILNINLIIKIFHFSNLYNHFNHKSNKMDHMVNNNFKIYKRRNNDAKRR